ncbi:hypothetical protein [Scale drop disease virus]|uniref:ORF_063L n=1 Tax=Scale drop disease virus TaxID=1697349 RepID=A0A0K1L6U4_9VIRU|nr:ORF_063L [Scale drop disease virus]AKU37478.1 ORF_063L [Scale drop disease virus]QLI60735.1 hypothetical protein [Scale drop disease virus]QXJ13653.1 ORF063L [Scale drop disease virus]UNH60721.1 hypothetical protein SDDV_ORF052 [Scale drop disease virus]
MEPFGAFCFAVLVACLYKKAIDNIDSVMTLVRFAKTVALTNMPQCVRNYFHPLYIYSEARIVSHDKVQVTFKDEENNIHGTVTLVRDKRPFVLTNNKDEVVTHKYKHYFQWEQTIALPGLSVVYT